MTGANTPASVDRRGMDWHRLVRSELRDAAFTPGTHPSDGPSHAPEPETSVWWGPTEPTSLDLALLEIAYDCIAEKARCSACQAPLGRRLRLDCWPTLVGTVLWRVRVKTSCTGWRRHRFSARVTQASRDLVLGEFRPRRSS